MDVSVVVPTRNRSLLLATTLRSVLRQKEVDLEVIVIDEASTDDTAGVVAGLNDPRLRIIRHDRPRGVAAARNHGAFEARGEWLAFIDDDDLWAPEKLMLQLEAARAVGREWAYAGSVNFVDDCRVTYGVPPMSPEEVMAALPRYNAVPGGGSNVIVRRATWRRAGPFDTQLRNTEDWEMWLRLAKLGPPAYTPRPLIGRRLHASNSTLDIAEIIRGTKLIEQIHHTTADWGRLHRWLAQSCTRGGDRMAALEQFARAAACGEIWGVASDLSAILRRRLFRLVGIRERRIVSDSPWMAEAAMWLRDF
jgi:glycosyltransferase involved in cell wall biosynthesis